MWGRRFRLEPAAIAALGLGVLFIIACEEEGESPSSAEPAPDPWALKRAAAAANPAHQPVSEGDAARLGGARIDAAGAHVARPGIEVTVALAALGRPGAAIPVRSATPVIEGPEVRIERAPGVVEWWRSLEQGLEQGVTLDARPMGRGSLRLDMSVGQGVRPELVDDDTVALLDGEGELLAHYAHLHVVDAAGAQLPAAMAVIGERIRLEVDDRDARYPIVVDPLLDMVPTTLTGVDGVSVGLSPDGNWAIVGSNNGATVFYFSGGAWTPIAQSPYSDPGSVAFGASVAISSNGTHCVVGDPLFNGGRGRVQFFKKRRLGGGDRFDIYRSVVPVPAGAPLEADSRFGVTVAISDDAAHLFVGAPGDVHGLASGTVRYYTCSTTADSNMCTHRQVIAPNASGAGGSAFSRVAVDASATLLAVGAPAYLSSQGMVDVYTRSGSSFSHLQTVLAPGAQTGESFGASVATDGEWLLVGAHNYDERSTGDTGHGRVVAYRRPGASGSFGAGVMVQRGGNNDGLGMSVAIASGGGRAIAGMDHEGRVIAYDLEGTSWRSAAAHSLARTSLLGTNVSLSANGRRALAGAVGNGAAYVYDLYHRQGEPCSSANECANGHCVDGVCCASAGGEALRTARRAARPRMAVAMASAPR